MSMSDYYKNLRAKIGNDLIFMPGVAGIIRNEQGRSYLDVNTMNQLGA